MALLIANETPEPDLSQVLALTKCGGQATYNDKRG
jgi:hypothetical protein